MFVSFWSSPVIRKTTESSSTVVPGWRVWNRLCCWPGKKRKVMEWRWSGGGLIWAVIQSSSCWAKIMTTYVVFETFSCPFLCFWLDDLDKRGIQNIFATASLPACFSSLAKQQLLPTVKVVAKPVPWALQVVFCSCKKSLRNGVPWCSCFLFLNQVSKRSKPEDFARKPDGNQWTLLSLQHLYSLLRRTSAMQTPSFFGKHCEGLLLR